MDARIRQLRAIIPRWIEGTRVHWLVDYCMATLSTDDEIAAASRTRASSVPP